MTKSFINRLFNERREIVGNQEVLGEVYQYYYQDLMWYGLSLTNNQEESEYLISDAFYKLLLNIEELEANHLKYWLMNVMKHQFLDNQKRQKTRENYLKKDKKNNSVYLDGNVEPFDNVLKQKEQRLLLLKMIQKLPEIYHELLVLHYFLDFSIQEIAGFTQRSNGQVRTILYRGRKMLKERIGEKYDVFF